VPKNDKPLRVEASYISIDFFRRLVIGMMAFLMSYFLLILFYAYLWFQLKFGFSTNVIYVLLVPALTPAMIVFLSERILKKMASKWSYSEFLFLQNISVTVLTVTVSYFTVFLLVSLYLWLHRFSLPLWAIVLSFAMLLAALIAISFNNFYSLKGNAIIKFLTIIEELDRLDKADFEEFLLGARYIGKIASKSNIEIQPYSICLGLSLTCIKSKKEAKADLRDLVKWIKNPRQSANFNKFTAIIKKYTDAAKAAADSGITEKHHWSFERATTLLNVLIVPLAATTLVLLVPELIKTFSH
jgi:hypothetical protein